MLPVSLPQGKPLRGGRPGHEQSRALSMDGRYWDGPAARPRGFGREKGTARPGKDHRARARQRAIGRELRRMYDEVVQDRYPANFSTF